MTTSLVLTILGPDRKGLVGSLADIVTEHGGSWQESRMARLSGQFAGILRVQCPLDRQEALEEGLSSLEQSGLKITVAHDHDEGEREGSEVNIAITGHDEPGIVKRVAKTLSRLGVNVEELETHLESAPMAGHQLFCTRGRIRIPEGLEMAELVAALEEVGSDFTVDLL